MLLFVYTNVTNVNSSANSSEQKEPILHMVQKSLVLTIKNPT